MSNNFTEIGSEFWIEREPESLLMERDGVYTISGRTAIDLILQDILKKRAVRHVMMPAWCCDSMIAPFNAHGIEVRFYDISVSRNGDVEYHIENIVNTDIFYLTNYFGYENTLSIDVVRQIKEQGSIILYDRTHSFLMDDRAYREVADYTFASIRKWMGIVGGAMVEGLTEDPTLKDCPYATIKVLAMHDKFRFLQGDNTISKDSFLASFGDFGHRLADDYCNYAMDDLSYTLYRQENMGAMIQSRRENARFIHEHLEGFTFVSQLTETAVPLFVPILFMSKEQRDSVRKKLIEKQIYCPIHWPQPKGIPASFKVNDIVNRELSLLCDQRYGLTEMERMVTEILMITKK